MALIWAPGPFIFWWQKRMKSGARCWGALVRFGTGTKCGCLPPVELYFAFPALYASAFSGFYLPLMIVLWLLILRGASIEFRNHIKSAVWDPLWDFLFWASSLLLAVFFGAALGNVVRGVPLDSSGYFFEPLWTNFRLGDDTGILDWYTIQVGVLALLAL